MSDLTPQAHPNVSPLRWLALLLALLVIVTAVASCDTEIPTPPAITVVITAVDNTDALAQGVAEALTSTAQVNIGLTETVLAQGGVTLTPSTTPTVTTTPTATTTRFFTPTPTLVPSATLTPTFALLPTNETVPAAADAAGWIRFAHAWRNVGSTDTQPLDVYLNDQRVAMGVDYGSATAYFRVQPGAVQISVRPSQIAQDVNASMPPLNSKAITVPPGGLISVVVANFGVGPELVPLTEDPSPVGSGSARLLVFQANPALPAVDIFLPNIQRAIGFSVVPRGLNGAFNIPAASYTLDLYDVSTVLPQFLFSTQPFALTSRLNYLLVITSPQGLEFGSSVLFSGASRFLDTEVGAHFINIAAGTGNLNVFYNTDLQLPEFPLGGITDSLPLPKNGLRLLINNSQNREVYQGLLGPLPPEDAGSDQIVLFVDDGERVGIKTFAQNPPPSVINASLRLIHALPGTRPLSLEIRPAENPLTTKRTADEGWVNVGQADFTNASGYVGRTPGVYEARVLLSGTGSVIDQLPAFQMSAGGTYDFVMMPDVAEGSVRLMLIQPSAQNTQENGGQAQATAVFEAVAATLTAQSPVEEASPTALPSPTATRTPPPTNTPRPTNTPEFAAPSVQVDPAPPNTVSSTLDIFGQHFAAKTTYTISLDNDGQAILTGSVQDDGSISETLELPPGLSAGPHVVRVCADCRLRGAQQETFAVFLVAPANLTATPTVRP